MKNTLLYMLAIAALPASAQQDTTAGKSLHPLKTNDEVLPRVNIDLNFKYGWAADANVADQISKGAYAKSQENFAAVQFREQKAIGGDIQFGYFFGKKHNFGIGTGFMYLQQKGNMELGSFQVAYQRDDVFKSNDGKNGTYKQLIKANDTIRETFTNVNMSIPVLARYKHQFKSPWGVFADAGGVFSISSVNTVNSTNAKFDYEAIYVYDANGNAIYDANPNADAVLITKDFITKQNATASNNPEKFFDDNFPNYNVGLSKGPRSSTSEHKYNTFALGALIQAGFSYQLNYRMTANIGGFYMYQVFKNDNTGMLTDEVSDYKSLFKIVDKVNNQSYGINIGVRYFLGKAKDVDGDMIPDVKDECEKLYGLAAFNGCPDSDGDGVRDANDDCPFELGAECTFGCPDRDNDCVPDSRDQCPDVYAESGWATMGCPDMDKDGVADKDDNCPEEPGLNDVQHHGCPEGKTPFAAPDPATLAPHHVVLSKSIINFKTGKKDIDSATLIELNDIVKALNEDNRLKVFISGHTDDVGSYARNMMLSFERAETLKSFLENKGVSKERIMISGYGKMDPIIENDSPENRAKNRRIEVRMLMPLWK